MTQQISLFQRTLLQSLSNPKSAALFHFSPSTYSPVLDLDVPRYLDRHQSFNDVNCLVFSAAYVCKLISSAAFALTGASSRSPSLSTSRSAKAHQKRRRASHFGSPRQEADGRLCWLALSRHARHPVSCRVWRKVQGATSLPTHSNILPSFLSWLKGDRLQFAHHTKL